MSVDHELLQREAQLYSGEPLQHYLSSSEQFNESHVPEYKKEGFLAINKVISEERIERSLEGIDHILRSRFNSTREEFEASFPPIGDNPGYPIKLPHAKYPFVQIKKIDENQLTESFEEFELCVRKIANYVPFEERLRAAAYDPNIIKVVTELLGDQPVLVQSMALLKPPQGGEEKPWHQDMAYRGLDFDKAVVGVWIALDSVTEENGCMYIVPKSHTLGGVPHYAVRDWQICDTSVTADRAVSVPLPPGGALFFHGLLHHGTPTNNTHLRRRALQFHYAAASSLQMDAAAYKNMFTNAISDAEC